MNPAPNRGIPVVFALMMELAKALGVGGISKMPGCWEHDVGDTRLVVNGHMEPTTASDGSSVPPVTAVLQRAGWVLCMATPFDGVCCGMSEGEVTARLRAEIARVKEAS